MFIVHPLPNKLTTKHWFQEVPWQVPGQAHSEGGRTRKGNTLATSSLLGIGRNSSTLDFHSLQQLISSWKIVNL